MQSKLEYIVEQISVRNPLHGKKLKANMQKADADYFNRTEAFLAKYSDVLHRQGRTLDDAVDAYLQVIADVNYETLEFLRTGEYSSTSFAEVQKRVYDNPAVMDYYMHGLMLSQFLWPHHYQVLLFFEKIIKEYATGINQYLEVGGGHGLYISEAVRITGGKPRFTLLDISRSSLEMAALMLDSAGVNMLLADVFEHSPDRKYDFITLGEVMEHVEDPLALLQKIHSMLDDEGRLFVTTPANAPAIDHIYLFRNAEEIREVIARAGFRIVDELCVYAEDVTPEVAVKFKVSMMFAGLLVKR